MLVLSWKSALVTQRAYHLRIFPPTPSPSVSLPLFLSLSTFLLRGATYNGYTLCHMLLLLKSTCCSTVLFACIVVVKTVNHLNWDARVRIRETRIYVICEIGARISSLRNRPCNTSHCNTLQHTATHCNTLQQQHSTAHHTSTRCQRADSRARVLLSSQQTTEEACPTTKSPECSEACSRAPNTAFVRSAANSVWAQRWC